MAQDPKTLNINFNLDPNKVKILYADTCLISNTNEVVVLGFAQIMSDPTQQNVVARIALTRAQAKDFLKTLNDHLERFEVS